MTAALLLSIGAIEASPAVVNITNALLILLAGFIAGKLLGLLLKTVLHQFDVDKHIAQTLGYRLSLERQLSTLLSYLAYAAAVIVALREAGILRYALIIIGGAFALVIIISLTLSLRDAIPDLVSGLGKSYRRLKPGESIKVRGIKGTIVKKGLFVLVVREGEDEVRVPNRILGKGSGRHAASKRK